MEKRFRRNITPVNFPGTESEPEFEYKNGIFTFRGKTLERLQAMAESEGVSIEELVNGRLREIINRWGDDPEGFRAFVLELRGRR
jgi:hypothetical protein